MQRRECRLLNLTWAGACQTYASCERVFACAGGLIIISVQLTSYRKVKQMQTTSGHTKHGGTFFEVKPRLSKPPVSSLTSNHYSCPSLLNTGSSLSSESSTRRRTSSWGEMTDVEEEEIQYRLQLIGSVPVHYLTTMSMLPWVVAEILRTRKSSCIKSTSYGSDVLLCVSALWIRCVSVSVDAVEWHPLRHTVLFECRPYQVTKLLHNSQEPNSFGFLVKGSSTCACYVFQCNETTQKLKPACTLIEENQDI
ncbi:hypothetical protein WMY93_005831 [Mugilogobius chulae]|uniref:PID domain-containing protein n=1 Tax=Mugilogobius chulae TaxID=88201 RepID=A0AAW0PKP0_9GOBI